ncbi:GNAT family N-acetyltransferase [Nisaea sediminum]|uniref:GNAT family N-acetyltransferase n=1 Tax=Nisaea sediminum TaxID=2775867 RepID=UPI001868CE4C|nr:GNAT family N-acetyltransferase [Nisaea sediminum]
MNGLRPLDAFTPEMVGTLRQRIGADPACSLYLETALDATRTGARNRFAHLSDSGGVILAISFDGLDVVSTLGPLDEADYRLLATSGRKELQLAPAHARHLREQLAGRRFRERDAHFYIRPQTAALPEHPANVRRLGPENEVEVAAFMQAHNRETVFSNWMLSGYFCAAFEAGEIVATAGTVITHRASGRANIGNLLTAPGKRGRGFARAALSALIRTLQENGIPDLSLVTTAENRAARALAESLGFKSLERRVQFDVEE